MVAAEAVAHVVCRTCGGCEQCNLPHDPGCREKPVRRHLSAVLANDSDACNKKRHRECKVAIREGTRVFLCPCACHGLS